MKAKEKVKVKEQNLIEEINIPEGISAELNEETLTLKKGDEEVKRKINPRVDVKIDGNKLILKSVRNRKTEKKVFGTMKAHIKNMVRKLQMFTFQWQLVMIRLQMN